MAASSSTTADVWPSVFRLVQADGFCAFEDIVAALECSGKSHTAAMRAVERSGAEARGVDADRFGALLDECVASSLGDDAADAAKREASVVRHALGVLKTFERRLLARGEFMTAAECRHRGSILKDAEAERQKVALVNKQAAEKAGVEQAHVLEAMEFNRAWSANVDEFEGRAAAMVQELHDRQAAAYEAYESEQRLQTIAAQKSSKEMLALKKIQVHAMPRNSAPQSSPRHSAAPFGAIVLTPDPRSQVTMARTGKYLEAEKYSKKVAKLAKSESLELQAKADAALEKKLEVFAMKQAVEMEGLLARISRGRAEHKAHWETGATRLVQSHKNMVTDLGLRQGLESTRAAVLLKSQIAPAVKPPDSPTAAKLKKGALPPPRQRPSKLAQAR